MKTFIVDSFTSEPFKGNPAGVCFPDHELDEVQMLRIAQEFGLSETAFVRPTRQTNVFGIRYFSPRKEIPLCGHATLASAKVIFETTNERVLHFNTVENLDLLVTKKADEIVMEFPVYDTKPISVPENMLKALGLTSLRNTAFSTTSKIILIEIDSPDVLRSLKPDFAALVNSYRDINGVLITAASNTDVYDYHYRYFWPWAGTNEDPVTGGVQTFLAKYWSERLNKKVMRAFQSSARTGYMSIELRGAKVLIRSEAVIVLEGELRIRNKEGRIRIRLRINGRMNKKRK